MSVCYRTDGRSNIARVQRKRNYAFEEPCAGTISASSAAASAATGVTVTFSGNVTTAIATGVKITENGGLRSITNVSTSTNTATYTVSPALTAASNVAISYDGLGDIQDADGDLVASFSFIETAGA